MNTVSSVSSISTLASDASVASVSRIPSNYYCPIMQEVMRSPASTIHGQVYEEDAIQEWLLENDTDPLTGRVLESKVLTYEDSLRRSIESYFEKRPQVASDIGYVPCTTEEIRQRGRFTVWNEWGLGNVTAQEFDSLLQAQMCFMKSRGARVLMSPRGQEVASRAGANLVALNRLRRKIRRKRGERVPWGSYAPDVAAGCLTVGGAAAALAAGALLAPIPTAITLGIVAAPAVVGASRAAEK